jgi:hypothetical protein
MILLYNWLSAIYWTPGPLNSNLIKTEKAVPNSPENKANIKYSVPISLAFEDQNHLSVHKDTLVFFTDKLNPSEFSVVLLKSRLEIFIKERGLIGKTVDDLLPVFLSQLY